LWRLFPAYGVCLRSFSLCAGACAPLSFGQDSAQPTAQRAGRTRRPPLRPIAFAQGRVPEDYAGLGMTRTEMARFSCAAGAHAVAVQARRRERFFCSTGNTRGSTPKGDAQIQRIPSKELDDLRSPLRFLLGHTQLEKELSGLKAGRRCQRPLQLSGLPKGQENRVRGWS